MWSHLKDPNHFQHEIWFAKYVACVKEEDFQNGKNILKTCRTVAQSSDQSRESEYCSIQQKKRKI